MGVGFGMNLERHTQPLGERMLLASGESGEAPRSFLRPEIGDLEDRYRAVD
ncbi:hypothetical protein Tamer19_52260 [Cupriavidus sp. TA19]|nr:hypothetical protein Tamer19_52260 [Cupriavidus sp. TA19]